MSGLGTLSTLPPELRVEIYRYALFDTNEETRVVLTIHRKLSEEAERQRISRFNRGAAESRPLKPVAIKILSSMSVSRFRKKLVRYSTAATSSSSRPPKLLTVF